MKHRYILFVLLLSIYYPSPKLTTQLTSPATSFVHQQIILSPFGLPPSSSFSISSPLQPVSGIHRLSLGRGDIWWKLYCHRAHTQRDTAHTRTGTPHDSFTYSVAPHQLGVSIGDVRLTHPPLPSAVLLLPVNVMLVSLTYIKREWVTCNPAFKTFSCHFQWSAWSKRRRAAAAALSAPDW